MFHLYCNHFCITIVVTLNITLFMPKTISKTMRLPENLVREIEIGAEKNNISQGQYCMAVFTEYKNYKLKEVFQENLLRMEQDEAYKKEQHDLAEADFS